MGKTTVAMQPRQVQYMLVATHRKQKSNQQTDMNEWSGHSVLILFKQCFAHSHTIQMCSNAAKQLLVIETMTIYFSFCIYPSHSLNVEQFTEDMVQYFGADLPIILFDRDAMTSPLSLRMAASFIEFDRTEPGMESEVVKGSCSVLVHF